MNQKLISMRKRQNFDLMINGHLKNFIDKDLTKNGVSGENEKDTKFYFGLFG